MKPCVSICCHNSLHPPGKAQGLQGFAPVRKSSSKSEYRYIAVSFPVYPEGVGRCWGQRSRLGKFFMLMLKWGSFVSKLLPQSCKHSKASLYAVALKGRSVIFAHEVQFTHHREFYQLLWLQRSFVRSEKIWLLDLCKYYKMCSIWKVSQCVVML